MQKNHIRFIGAYSLVEISIVLLIIGILTGAMFKGKDIIDAARMRSVISDVQSVQMAFAEYLSIYGAMPGNDLNVKDASPGKGDGVFTKDDAQRCFKHLFVAGLIDSENFKAPKIGGAFKIVEYNNQPYLQISGLAISQILQLSSKARSIFGESNIIANQDSKSISFALN